MPPLEEEWDVCRKCDLRVGKVLEIMEHPQSDYLYKEKVDVGEGYIRDIGSGLQGKISKEELLDGLVVVFANLKPRTLADFKSDGMLMCANNADQSEFELVRPPAGAKVGDRIQLKGNPCGGVALSGEASEKLNPKKDT